MTDDRAAMPAVAPGQWTVATEPEANDVRVSFERTSDAAAFASQLEHWRLSLMNASTAVVVLPELVSHASVPSLRYPAPSTVGVKLPASYTAQDVLANLTVIANALDTLHARGIVHGALGIHSLWWMPDRRLHFPDAALAHALDGLAPPADEMHLYSAPEVWRGHSRLPASDQYSLAAIAYELFTHRSREAPRRVEGIMALEPIELDPIALTVAGVPALCADALQRALSAMPRARYESCSAFTDALAVAFSASAPTTMPSAKRARIATHILSVPSFATVMRIAGLAIGVMLVVRYRDSVRSAASLKWLTMPSISTPAQPTMITLQRPAPSTAAPPTMERGRLPVTAPSTDRRALAQRLDELRAAGTSAAPQRPEANTTTLGGDRTVQIVTGPPSRGGLHLPTPVADRETAPGLPTLPSTRPLPGVRGSSEGRLAEPKSAAPSTTPVGVMRLELPDGSRVYIDGVALADSRSRLVPLAVGLHDVDVLTSAGKTIRHRITVTAQDTATVRVARP